MQIKTTMRNYFTPVRMTIIKMNANNKCWQECGGKRALIHCCWERNRCSHCGSKMDVSQKTKNKAIVWLSNSTLSMSPKPQNSNSKRYTHPQCSLQHYFQLPRCGNNVSINRWMDKEEMVYIHKMEYYSAMKKNEILSFATRRMDLEGIMLDEIS